MDTRNTVVSGVLSLCLAEMRKTSKNPVQVENKYVYRDES
jgi:hypothetical protein